MDRREALLEGELDAVGDGLQQTEGSGAVGAGSVLHERHDAALEPGREQREQQKRHEDDQDLEHHQPERVLAEVGQGYLVGGEQGVHAAPPLMRTTSP